MRINQLKMLLQIVNINTSKCTMCTVVPEKSTPSMEGIISQTPPLWKFQLSFIYFFNIFSLTDLPSPGSCNPFCGESVILFWNCTRSVNPSMPQSQVITSIYMYMYICMLFLLSLSDTLLQHIKLALHTMEVYQKRYMYLKLPKK